MPGVFPQLRTGAVAQYPWRCELETTTEVLQFLDGSEQAYQLRSAPRRRWTIELTLLDDNEVATLRAFFRQQKGRWGTFSFNDPVSGATYDKCGFESDVFPQTQEGEGRNRVRLVVAERL
jgi:hypothetical protein